MAESGDPQAQLELAGLYEAGGEGLDRDLVSARRWTERAARRGDRIAMHNLGLFMMSGDGGPRNVPEAAAWFQRAAELGVVDAQYNFARILESGQGVPRNLRESYRWFAIAANAGDMAAREKQVELEPHLQQSERADLDRRARQFVPGRVGDEISVAVVPPATTLTESQAFLSRRGYYLGAIDGLPSQAYADAVQAYLKDHPVAVGSSR
jgi:localization factor PodJL